MRPSLFAVAATSFAILLAAAPHAAAQTPAAILPPAPVPADLTASSPPAPSFSMTALTFDEDDQRPYRRTPTAPPKMGARIFGAVDLEHMTASQSFAATVGTATLFGFGGGVDIVNIGGGGIFLRFAVSDMSKSGTRSDGTTFSNGIPLNVHMIPVDVAGGWRFHHVSKMDAWVPYVGAGALFLHYSEVTPSGNTSDNTVSWFSGFEAFAGVDMQVGKSVSFAPEVDFRTLANAIGTGGTSLVYNENNLGGVTLRVTIGVRVGGR